MPFIKMNLKASLMQEDKKVKIPTLALAAIVLRNPTTKFPFQTKSDHVS